METTQFPKKEDIINTSAFLYKNRAENEDFLIAL